MMGVCVLGATGSIGTSTLDVVARHPDRFRVVALAARRDAARMAELCGRFAPVYAAMSEPSAAAALREQLRADGVATEVLEGEAALRQVASLDEVDSVMAAIVGAAGLLPTLEAVRAGKRVLLANKEALVMAGRLFMDEVAHSRAELVPIDSEHNAILQCLPAGRAGLDRAGVERILLTASGGPFRTMSRDRLARVTPEEACAHPNWDMGRKISVDSATMMNKGLELIEACWLFDTVPERIRVVVHPQSVVHSMVEYVDGSVLAQLGNPDMRTPIAHALAWPERVVSGVASLDLFEVARLDFEPPDTERFPCLHLAAQGLALGDSGPAVLNAANEVAVAAFLDGGAPFTGIAAVIEATLAEIGAPPADSIEAILELDRRAREVARKHIGATARTFDQDAPTSAPNRSKV